jgi:hypothetical protein
MHVCHTYIHTYVYIYIYIYINTHNIHTTNTHARTHARAHTHTHTYIQGTFHVSALNNGSAVITYSVRQFHTGFVFGWESNTAKWSDSLEWHGLQNM